MPDVDVPLIDAHMHLQEEVLEGHVERVVERARMVGVHFLACNGTHPGDWDRTLELARTYRGIVPCLGLHPWFIDGRPPGWLERLADLTRAGHACVGEAGLDALSPGAGVGAQLEVLLPQLELAKELRRPAMIHCVRAFGHLLAALTEVGPLPAGFLLHSYAGPPDLVPQFARLGAVFSFGGNVLDERHKRARRSLASVPENRLLVETDAPALLPPPDFRTHVLRGDAGRLWNEPANLPAILRGIAALRGTPPEDLARLVWRNAQRLLGDLLWKTDGSPESSR